MNTPRFRFTVIPTLLALFVGLLHQPATTVVKVGANGMGFEHEQPWRARTSGLMSTITSIGARLTALQRHTLFKPIAAAAAVVLAVALDERALFAAPFVIGATLTEGTRTAEALVWEANSLFRKSVTVLSGQNLKANTVVGRVRVGIGRVSIPTVSGTGNGTVSAVFAGPDVEVGNYVITCTATATHGGTFSVLTPSGKLLPALVLTPGSGGSTAYTSRHINFTITDGGTDFAVNDSFTFVVGTTAPTVIGGTGTGTISALSLGADAMPGNYRVICREAITNGGRFEVIAPDGTSLGPHFLMTAGSGTATAFTSRQINFTLTDNADFIVGNYFDVCVFNQLNGGKVVAWDPTTFDGRHRVAGVLYQAVDASAADGRGVVIDTNAVVAKGALQWGAAITASQKDSAYLELAAKNVTALDTAA
jgi:hypothetical protein